MKKFASLALAVVMLAAMLTVFAVPASADILSPGISTEIGIDPEDVSPTDEGLQTKSEVDPETLTIIGTKVDAAQNRVLLKVGSELTADVNPTVANFLSITVKKGAEVTVRIEHKEAPAEPWTVLPDVKGKAIIDRTGADIEVELNGNLPAQGYFRAKVEELEDGEGSVFSEGNIWIIVTVAVVVIAGIAALVIVKKKTKPALAGGTESEEE